MLLVGVASSDETVGYMALGEEEWDGQRDDGGIRVRWSSLQFGTMLRGMSLVGGDWPGHVGGERGALH